MAASRECRANRRQVVSCRSSMNIRQQVCQPRSCDTSERRGLMQVGRCPVETHNLGLGGSTPSPATDTARPGAARIGLAWQGPVWPGSARQGCDAQMN